VTQEAVLRLFERVLWEALAEGPGADAFGQHGVWPVVRKATLEYHAETPSGTVLCFETVLTHHGRTSFTLHHTARRQTDQGLVAEADFVFVCLGEDRTPMPVPRAIQHVFGARHSVRAGAFQHMIVRGVATAVDVQGDGPPMLFIHGFPLDRTMWRDLIAPLTGRRRVAPDLRGLGLSDVPESGYSMQEYADDMGALLDVLGLEQVAVCGLSMGGYVALEMMRRHKDRVRALILMNTRAEPDDDEARAGRDEMIQLVQRQGPAALADLLLPKLLAPTSLATTPDVVERVRTMITSSPATGVIGALSAIKQRPDSRPDLGAITVPTLVVAGREDQLIPAESSRFMADRIPDAHLTMIAGAGHLSPMEQPTATSRVISEFLESLD
jgi:pimeloyl-ACP methyl ester carboxylesterase